MGNKLYSIFASLVIFMSGTQCVFAQGTATSQADVASEMFLFKDIPVVYSASKKAQLITESPASIFLLTEEDIHMYPGTELYDSLRQVPGIDVRCGTEAQPDVSIRGMNEYLTNYTQLLADGRNVYLPSQGMFMWPTLNLQPAEIKQIEVVKGPVASLYGANAVNGLINVISKKPEEIDGTIFTQKSGTDLYTYSSLVHGQKIEDIGYKVSGSWKEKGGFL